MADADPGIRERMRGVAVTNATIFTDAGAVDSDAIAAHVRFLVDAGIRVLVPCGNTGEFSSLGSAEAAQVVATTVEAADGRATVVAGVGWSLPAAIELARAAQEAGASAVMVHQPVHTYIDRIGVRAYYERLLDAIDLPAVIYKRGPDLTDELLAELVEDERVIAVKYAVNDVHAFSQLARDRTSEAVWMCGTAERWAPFFHLGGASTFSSGLANVAPHRALALADALEARDYEEAMRLRDELVPFEDLREEDGSAKNVPAVKEAMRLAGLCANAYVREPLRLLSSHDARRVQAIVRAWNVESRPRLAAPDDNAGKGVLL